MLLSVESFWRGNDSHDRRVTYFDEYNPRQALLEHNAAETISRIQLVFDSFEADTGIKLSGKFSSGWRPAEVNAATHGSGHASQHLDAAAGDVIDTPDGHFAWWCFHHQELLQKDGLWMEHPSATVLCAINQPWCHLQIFAPKSGARVFHPTTDSVTKWDAFLASKQKAPGDNWA